MAQVYTGAIISEVSKALVEMTGNDKYDERIQFRLNEIDRLLKLVRFNLRKPK